jgi:ketosteroid isomerase-like protein
MEPDNVELVRRLWEAFERGGIEAVLEIADPDVEWEPYAGGGVVYRGHAGLRAYMEGRAQRDEEVDARLYSAVGKGDAVVARGEVRIRGPQGIVTMQPGWLYEFRDGKLVRFRGYPSNEAALRAAGMARDDPASIVRDLWAGFNRLGVEGMLEFIHEDAEWHTYLGRQDVYEGHEGIRRYYDEVTGRASDVTVTDYAIREIGDAILVSGSLQVDAPDGGFTQRQVHWVYWLDEGKVRRAASFALREQAEQAAREGVVQTRAG